jgi:hypothetical protein
LDGQRPKKFLGFPEKRVAGDAEDEIRVTHDDARPMNAARRTKRIIRVDDGITRRAHDVTASIFVHADLVLARRTRAW